MRSAEVGANSRGASVSGGGTQRLPRCPFTRLGLDTAGMSGCPGFVAETRGITEVERWELEVGIAPGVTCAHLGVQLSPQGGFISACLYPGGPPALGMPTLVGPGHPVPPVHTSPVNGSRTRRPRTHR
jgi:hypothetical protein